MKLETKLTRRRKVQKSDFQGKTIAFFSGRADNLWKFQFTDGTSLSIEALSLTGLAYMEIRNAHDKI